LEEAGFPRRCIRRGDGALKTHHAYFWFDPAESWGAPPGRSCVHRQSGEREMTQTLEGTPAVRRTLGRRVTALRRGSAIRATGVPTATIGHRGEAGPS